MEIRNILRKKPFYRIAPPMFDNIEMVSDITTSAANTQKVQYIIRTQADFLREYDVSGHKINSRFIYPDKVSKDEKGNIVIHHIARMALPLQKMITKKHLVYCCGNDIEFRLLTPNPTEEDEILRSKFKEGWISKNMEIAFYAAIKADKVTGDCAFCGVLQGGKFSWRVFSYLDGDTLYPQYDRMTGELNAFGRKYSQFDERGEEVIEYLDVWDNEYIYHFKRDNSTASKRIANKVKQLLGLDGWIQDGTAKQHGFPYIPIAYHRTGHPCWDASQDNIEAYEFSISQLAENNKAYALRILFTKGEEFEMGATVDGTPISITASDTNSDAKFLEPADSSASFELQLKTLEDNIYRGSFVSKTPDIKGSDVSSLTVRLLFADSAQQAFNDSQDYDLLIDGMVKIFKTGYGTEMGEITTYNKLEIIGSIVPYMYMSETEEINNLMQLVSMGAMSKRSASEIAYRIGYGVNGEWMRRMKEEREALTGEENSNSISKPTNPISQARRQMQNN